MKNPTSRLTRIRLDLEEYDFDIVYIRGKDNVLADALSRISIKDLRDMYDEPNILAITRSMARNESIPKPDNIEDKLKPVNVIEEFDGGYYKKIPRIKTQSISFDKYSSKILSISVGVFKAHRRIFNFTLCNEISVKRILLELQKLAGGSNIYELQISKQDAIFKMYTINHFKEIGNKELSSLIIRIIKPPMKVTEESKKLEILKTFHLDPLFGGHNGQKKLYAKLRNKFYWRNMTKDISKFVRQCENCKKNKHRRKTREEMVITETPLKPFDTLIIDTIIAQR